MLMYKNDNFLGSILFISNTSSFATFLSISALGSPAGGPVTRPVRRHTRESGRGRRDSRPGGPGS